MNQAPRRQEYPPLEGMYVFSPASALSFSDGVNQHCFWWSGDSFHQMSLWLCFFCLLIRILFANWCCLECASQKGHSNAPTCILLLPCEVFYLKKNLCAEASLLCYWRAVFTPVISLLSDDFFCSKHETGTHRHSRPSFNSIKTQQQYFMETSKIFVWAAAVKRFPLLLTVYNRKEVLGKFRKMLPQQRSSSTMLAI